jgi:alpha-mannosidase
VRPARSLARAVVFAVGACALAHAEPPPPATAPPGRDLFPAGWLQGWASSVEGRKLSYRWAYPGYAVSLLCRAMAEDWAVSWNGAPPPAVAPGDTVTYLFHVGLNSSTSPHRFELQLDGRPVATFDTSGGTANREWTVEGKDGARLRFVTTRLGGFDERFGFLALSLPRRALGAAAPRFRLVPEAAGNQDYVLVFEEPVRAWAKVAAEEAVLKGGRRMLTADVSHLGVPAPFVATASGREIARGSLDLGHTRIPLGVPEGVTGSVHVRLESGGAVLLEEDVALRPVAQRTFHLIPHSHVDIGYSDPQPEVERKQWKNLRDAIAVARATAGGPKEARFHWQAEGLWAVESYLAQASEEERRAFAEAVRDGAIELPANLTNVLTGLCHPEELARWTDAARRVRSRYGLTVSPVAMHSDIPGLAWPSVTALAQAGVRYFSSGPNYMPNLKPDGGDRIGTTLSQLGDRPFWWVSPSGRERLLVWVAGRGYSWFHGGYLGRNADVAARGVLDYARELSERGYPYEPVQVRHTVGGDNGPVDPNLSDWVQRWNEAYDTPRLAISTAQDVFGELERRYGRELPEWRGDMTPYWEDGALSSAAEEASARAAARRLMQAEALAALNGAAAFPSARADEGWRQLLLWHEHTWGAAASISEPDRPDVVAQWDYKRAFAAEADRASRALLAEALGQAKADGRFDVVDTSGQRRSGLVLLPSPASGAAANVAGDRVVDERGRPRPSQRLRDGSLAVWLAEVPAFGRVRLKTVAGAPLGPPLAATASGARLESDRLAVEIDPGTGAIRSLVDRASGRQLAGRDGLARYRYVAGLDPALAKDAGPVSVVVEDAGPLVATLRVEGAAPGTSSLATRYRLVAGSDRLEVELRLDKSKVRAKESAHLTFDLAVEDGRTIVDQGWNRFDPLRDALPGSCREFVGVHDAVDAAGPAGGVMLGLLDSPLVELGALVDERPNPAGVRSWKTEPAAGTRLHAYLLNNYWHTNYKADQPGPLRFRFVLRPHGPEPSAALSAFSRELQQPLLVSATGPAPRAPRLEAGPGVLVVGLRPAPDGGRRLIRLLNASDGAQPARVDGGAPLTLQPWEVRELSAE